MSQVARTRKFPNTPEGSWKCEKCNNVNYPFRTKCYKYCCGADKPSGTNKSPSGQANENGQGARTRKFPNTPEGSWKCEKCNNVNYPFRTKCYKYFCGADKPSGTNKSPSADKPSGTNKSPSDQANENGQGARTRKFPNTPEGSWKCEKCNNVNYPFRTKCYKYRCGADKPSGTNKSPSADKPSETNKLPSDQANENGQPAANTMDASTFEMLGICDQVVRSCKLVGRKSPNESDKAVIPLVLGGNDIVGFGHVETPSFIIPILQAVQNTKKEDRSNLVACIVAPSADLVTDIYVNFEAFGTSVFTRLEFVPLVGTLSLNDDFFLPERRGYIIVATPEALASNFVGVGIFHHLRLATVQYMVLCGADRLKRKAIRKIFQFLPKEIKTYIFFDSATVGEKERALMLSYLKNHFSVIFVGINKKEQADLSMLLDELMPRNGHQRNVVNVLVDADADAKKGDQSKDVDVHDSVLVDADVKKGDQSEALGKKRKRTDPENGIVKIVKRGDQSEALGKKRKRTDPKNGNVKNGDQSEALGKKKRKRTDHPKNGKYQKRKDAK